MQVPTAAEVRARPSASSSVFAHPIHPISAHAERHRLGASFNSFIQFIQSIELVIHSSIPPVTSFSSFISYHIISNPPTARLFLQPGAVSLLQSRVRSPATRPRRIPHPASETHPTRGVRACVRSQPASIAEGRFKHKGAIEAGRTQGARFETDWRSETRDQRKANDERRTVDSGQQCKPQTADRRPQTGRLAERKLVRRGVEKSPSQTAHLRTVRVHRGAPTEAHSRGTTVLRERCSVRDKSVIRTPCSIVYFPSIRIRGPAQT